MSKAFRTLLSLSLVALLAACSGGSGGGSSEKAQQGIKIGKPYEISGHIYAPTYNPNYDETGVASWYGPGFHGGRTASGERYNQEDMTAAHKTLPLPSIVRVTNLDNGRSTIVRINDRGPFVGGRIIDLSRAAASRLGVLRTGTARVRVQFLDHETREYVSSLPNGPNSLKRLDMLAGEGAFDKANYHPETITASELGSPPPTADDNALPFVAPVYAPHVAVGEGVKPIAYVKPSQYSARQAEEQVPASQPMAQQAERHVSAPQYVADSQSSGAGYFIQAGTFGVKGNAYKLVETLRSISQAKVVESAHREKTFYRVLAGPYVSRQDAENILSKLDTAGISGAKIVRD